MLIVDAVKSHKGFTLIELITILVILGALLIVSVPRFSNVNSALQSSRDDVIAALFFAQQVAMARDSSTNFVRFVSTSSTISVTEGPSGSPVNLINGGTQYPLSLPAGITVTASTFNYDKLGRITSASNLVISDGSSSETIVVSSSGYAR